MSCLNLPLSLKGKFEQSVRLLNDKNPEFLFGMSDTELASTYNLLAMAYAQLRLLDNARSDGFDNYICLPLIHKTSENIEVSMSARKIFFKVWTDYF